MTSSTSESESIPDDTCMVENEQDKDDGSGMNPHHMELLQVALLLYHFDLFHWRCDM
ncbi:hypothetical protein GLOTRDRAFT_126236 [Gloeophyllum trabeum ATCC 11539]|uniref:Uncharacterized protein n=1 Tax=Gloeophyllum trabeum (strain ATCC 11539 / FP-39264 / Madison 617) TaxID=670483 RepID=S7QEA4_GLOTA|nr:uncharacterized protein GLOTRDRAFT_126236 [Gloeophyllum trabeum ATCC 11539]EPQ57742.1 hypothetical protein GLOTRDRAFT_126236 [Gloeophyllum trabeum ATCC 11539]